MRGVQLNSKKAKIQHDVLVFPRLLLDLLDWGVYFRPVILQIMPNRLREVSPQSKHETQLMLNLILPVSYNLPPKQQPLYSKWPIIFRLRRHNLLE